MEQVSQLAALAEAVFDYHKHCYDVMESLVATLNNKYVAAVYYILYLIFSESDVLILVVDKVDNR